MLGYVPSNRFTNKNCKIEKKHEETEKNDNASDGGIDAQTFLNFKISYFSMKTKQKKSLKTGVTFDKVYKIVRTPNFFNIFYFVNLDVKLTDATESHRMVLLAESC